MAFERARNIQDASVNPATFLLPAAASTSTTSAAVDLGSGIVYSPEGVELELSVPALSTTIAPDTRVVTFIIETSTTSNFSAVAQTILSDAIAGAGGTGIAAYKQRVRLSPNNARFVRAKVTFGASTTDGSALSATFTIRF